MHSWIKNQWLSPTLVLCLHIDSIAITTIVDFTLHTANIQNLRVLVLRFTWQNVIWFIHSLFLFIKSGKEQVINLTRQSFHVSQATPIPLQTTVVYGKKKLERSLDWCDGDSIKVLVLEILRKQMPQLSFLEHFQCHNWFCLLFLCYFSFRTNCQIQ